MPRTARASKGGFVYHVLNRGNGRNDVFHKPDDFVAFVKLMVEANERLPMRVTGYCLLNNHFHLLLWPHHDGDLSRWMQWLMTSHVRRYHRHYGGSGHVWQGRFKAFPLQEDEHYWTVLRYIERNPLRAGIVARSQDWEWSSLKPTDRSGPAGLLSTGPLEKRLSKGGRHRVVDSLADADVHGNSEPVPFELGGKGMPPKVAVHSTKLALLEFRRTVIT